jgi:L,D-peptidoglycan transpeptidase YkuD (ErfK/YbiS/YcfS/YnhG family)
MLDKNAITAASKTLHEHWRAGTKFSGLDDRLRPRDRVEAYAIQAAIEKYSSESLFGWKIAATSEAGQKHINVDGPMAGRILAETVISDGGTPRGTYYPRQLWWRADRHPKPRTFLPVRPIRPEDAWCEDPQDRHYNQPIRLVRDQAGDRLTREDHLYDFIVEIDHNAAPRIAGRGSAVFLHLARTNFSPTAGCVSMTKSAMLRLLRRMGPRTKIIIG